MASEARDDTSALREALQERIDRIERSGSHGRKQAGEGVQAGTTRRSRRLDEDDRGSAWPDVPLSHSIDPSARRSAFSRVVVLVNHSEQCTEKLLSRLVREGYAEDEAREAVERACACGLVDDRRYAEALVRGRLSQGKGRPGIRRELSSLKIDPEGLIGSDCDGYPEEDDRARALLIAKPPKAKNPQQSAYHRLIQKGYSSDVAASVARAWAEEERASRGD